MKALVSALLSSFGSFFIKKLEEKVETKPDINLNTEGINPLNSISNYDTMLEKYSPTKLKKELFIYTQLKNIEENWPLILEALDKKGLCNDDKFLCYVLATIKVENAKFKPSTEIPSKYSTKNGKLPYDYSAYENRKDLGNIYPGDCNLFPGRGLIQITGRNNYTIYDKKLKLEGGLLKTPEAANEPHIAAAILAEYFEDRQVKINAALATDDFVTLRKIVNGGTHGLDDFIETYKKAIKLFI